METSSPYRDASIVNIQGASAIRAVVLFLPQRKQISEMVASAQKMHRRDTDAFDFAG